MRSLLLWDAVEQSPFEAFRADQSMLAAVASAPESLALGRLWRRQERGVALGRYHRMSPGLPLLERRLSGGRCVPVGPGVIGFTLVVPELAWLDPQAKALRAEQVLNRALRPMLALLRELGCDAFYPGRDLVTVAGKPILHASFTTLPDGLCVVEQHVAVRESFSELGRLMARLDPASVAAIARDPFARAAPLDSLATVPTDPLWCGLLARHLEKHFQCGVEAGKEVAGVLVGTVEADEAAYRAFLAERGPLPKSWVSTAAASMLGVIEAAARVKAGRIAKLVVSGDLIAPFATLEAIGLACEGLLVEPVEIEAMLKQVTKLSGNFLLGGGGLSDLIGRLS